ncbi:MULTISPECIES: bifunctional 4-hydroxy-2-oxoglutarate aldolase/2-dehydro-3-deoxy-phosphogluconate aldolase [Heyndrickxia]|uniref:bifunctional 4-hydroxy-2-oxoglutarate aldolase/2-dehydro-3-deoxy-phosphogluconate aldolase n=1 Tax=Heyndrickxia TaxID=2837504 RepID=UPI0007794AFD|nr:bifunctional 4-hydroxy-2-oxoglutarate aldolase/2-dehydro-3-deoxy-phosphogluconate aldolase [Heyndrickxia coagulans]KYC60130.1 4-Hydroxy-2-oxoglutarate aldolase [Heyndrickxia coagulans]
MDTLNTIIDTKIVAIIRGADPKDVLSIVKALHEGGIRAVEIALNSPGALDLIKEVTGEMGADMMVGAGTVLDPESARAALLAGARFILSPTLNLETIKMTKRYGAVSIPGAYTPTEILQAFEAGADIIKVFPASALGPGYFKDVHGPLSQIPLLPTGGINLDNIRAYIEAGAVGVAVASALVNTNEEVTDSYLHSLTEKSKQYIEKAKQAK